MVSGEIFSLYSGWTSIHHVTFPLLPSPSSSSSPTPTPLPALTSQAIYTNCKSVKEVHLSTPVARVVSSPTTRPERYRYTLHGKDGQSLGEYDAVIMTAPMNPIHPIEWKLDGETLDLSPYLAEYQITHATFIKGTLRKDYFLRPPSPATSPSATPSAGRGFVGYALTAILGKKYENPDLLPSHVFLVDGADAKVFPPPLHTTNLNPPSSQPAGKVLFHRQVL
jgi:hypothetical protein